MNENACKPFESVGPVRLVMGFVAGLGFLLLGISFLYRGCIVPDLKLGTLGCAILLVAVAYNCKGLLYLRRCLKRRKG